MARKTVSDMRTKIRTAWYILDRACDKVRSSELDCQRAIRDALDEATKGERAHRATGARFTHGWARYRLPVEPAAMAIIIGHVYRGCGQASGHMPTWAEAASTRRDCMLAFALHDVLFKAEAFNPQQLEALREAAEIDYADDIADNREARRVS